VAFVRQTQMGAGADEVRMCWFSAAGITGASTHEVAGGRKAPRHEVAGSWAPAKQRRYEDLMRAPSLVIDVTLTGFDLCVCRYGRSTGCRRPFGGCSERVNARSAH
jgi:hypothetical protein